MLKKAIACGNIFVHLQYLMVSNDDEVVLPPLMANLLFSASSSSSNLFSVTLAEVNGVKLEVDLSEEPEKSPADDVPRRMEGEAKEDEEERSCLLDRSMAMGGGIRRDVEVDVRVEELGLAEVILKICAGRSVRLLLLD